MAKQRSHTVCEYKNMRCAFLMAAIAAGAYLGCTRNIHPHTLGAERRKLGSGEISASGGGKRLSKTERFASVGACVSPPPVKIIFDTDIGPDCDDAAAVSMPHAP